MTGKITPNLSTPESREFWASCERSAREIADWPDWRRAGINVSATRVNTTAPVRRHLQPKESGHGTSREKAPAILPPAAWALGETYARLMRRAG